MNSPRWVFYLIRSLCFCPKDTNFFLIFTFIRTAHHTVSQSVTHSSLPALGLGRDSRLGLCARDFPLPPISPRPPLIIRTVDQECTQRYERWGVNMWHPRSRSQKKKRRNVLEFEFHGLWFIYCLRIPFRVCPLLLTSQPTSYIV